MTTKSGIIGIKNFKKNHGNESKQTEKELDSSKKTKENNIIMH